MLELNSLIQNSSTDMLTIERQVQMLELLESLDNSLVAGRQVLAGLSSLFAKVCTLEQMAKLMVYSFPYWCSAAPCKLSQEEVGGVSTGGATWHMLELCLLTGT